MKKLMALALGICLIAGLGIVMSGCGQQTPTINTSNPQPNGLKIKGVVRGTTLNGTVGNPITGAVVVLSGDSQNKSSVTNAYGEYSIEGIPDGSYILIVTAEGFTRSSTTAVVIKPSSYIPADNTITVADIQLSHNPIVLSYSPTPNSVISNLPTFVVTFNEPMDTSTVVPSLTPNGIRTYSTTSSTIPLTVTWDTAGKVMTAVPQANLVTNEVYILNVDPMTSAKDTLGYGISNGKEQSQSLTQSFRVTTGGAPGAPSNITVVVNNKLVSSDATDGSTGYANFVDIININNYVGLNWTPSSGTVTGYRVYVADSATGNYVLWKSVAAANYCSGTIGSIISALYGNSAWLDPLGTANYPMINKTLYFKVIAYNGDGESNAATASVKELAGPVPNANVQESTYAGGTLNNSYYLPKLTASADDKKCVYIAFNEPIDASSLSAGNFTITAGGGSIVSVALMTNSSTDLGLLSGDDYAIVKVTTDTDLTAGGPRTLNINGVKDLAGNTMFTGRTVSLP